MAPRESYGDKPMTSAERVRRARWVNRFEETAYKLLDMLDEAPDPLPRRPEIPSELIEHLRPFIGSTKPEKTRKPKVDQLVTRVLKLGNGNQVRNKKRAMQYIAKHLNANIIDKRTVRVDGWGSCHVAAYTHPKGAMISTPHQKDQDYGGADWHKNDHIILFRDVGDGHCKIYISKIKPLFNHRTIGHHGVLWQKIEELSSDVEILDSQDVLNELDD